MRVYILRHGQTRWNTERRYQGMTDIPLSPEGEGELVRADFTPELVWVSPLCRARRTAELVFPQSRQQVVEAFREINFGAFEGRSFQEMEHDPDYQTWVEGGCVGRCPGGEDWAGFAARVCPAFEGLLDKAFAQEKGELVILAHGGVQLAVMEAYALLERDHFHWMGPCAGGYVLETDRGLWQTRKKLQLLHTVQYTKGAQTC